MPLAQLDDGELVAHAIGFDRFGNVMLDVEHTELTASGLRLGRKVKINGRHGVPSLRIFISLLVIAPATKSFNTRSSTAGISCINRWPS
jgi:S-adenosylmethionine hydrolase